MSKIRPIGDPAIATAMLATMQSIDAARSAPSGISEPRWRVLQCIAKAAPNVPSPGELRMCSGLNKAALAEHVQALQWKGLLEMGGYRLSPSAAEMVGIAQPYPPMDAKAMVLVEHGPRDEDAAVALQHAIAAMGVKDMTVLPPEPIAPVVIGFDIAARPDVSIEARVTFGEDGKIAKIEPLTPMDPADVPACLRPDCTPPAAPVSEECGKFRTNKQGNKHGRGGATVAHPSRAAAGSNPAPGQPAYLTPELVTTLRAAITPRKAPPQPAPADKSDRAGGGDSWERAARSGSEQLIRAIRRYHPERCGGA